MQKSFNTAGPIKPERHYHIPLLQRVDWEEIRYLIDAEKYFILHAPRQTGKTSTLLEMMRVLNIEGKYAALYANIEAAQAARGDEKSGIPTVCSAIADAMAIYHKDFLLREWFTQNQDLVPYNNLLSRFLEEWSLSSEKSKVLFLDEVDALIGNTLISLLRQIRARYAQRPQAFPQTIVLCGVRDVKDYRIHTRDDEIITGGSAFNIKTKSIRMGGFSEAETRALLLQHTEATGQRFDEALFEELWLDTWGQPWLVNALAHEMSHEDKEARRDRSLVIGLEKYKEARERLIQSRATHLDQLTDKLREERVRGVIAALLATEDDGLPDTVSPDDLQYVEDLGLIRTRPGVTLSNRIYQEIIPRELTWVTQVGITHDTAWYVKQDGSLDTEKLLKAFQQFFREHSDAWVEGFDYKEAGPQLLMQAFLQRIVNCGGRLSREYALGRKRTDLFIEWPLDEKKGFYGEVQKVVVELKILRGDLGETIQKGIEQTLEYSRQVGAQESHLVIFNRNPDVSWDEKIWQSREKRGERTVLVWGC